MLNLSYSREAVMRLTGTYQISLKSPPPNVISWIRR